MAGLPADCTAYGQRKTRAATLAESGATGSQIGAWTGHANLSDVSHSSMQAEQRNVLGMDRERKVGKQLWKVIQNDRKRPSITKA